MNLRQPGPLAESDIEAAIIREAVRPDEAGIAGDEVEAAVEIAAEHRVVFGSVGVDAAPCIGGEPVRRTVVAFVDDRAGERRIVRREIGEQGGRQAVEPVAAERRVIEPVALSVTPSTPL